MSTRGEGGGEVGEGVTATVLLTPGTHLSPGHLHGHMTQRTPRWLDGRCWFYGSCGAERQGEAYGVSKVVR